MPQNRKVLLKQQSYINAVLFAYRFCNTPVQMCQFHVIIRYLTKEGESELLFVVDWEQTDF